MMELAKIDGDRIVITIPFDALATACQVAWDEEYGVEEHSLKVTAPALLAHELVHELNREEEDGTTLVHLMMDKAVIRATEDGAFGIEGDADMPAGDA